MAKFSGIRLNKILAGDSTDRKIDIYLLLLIILTGTILRTWDLFNMSFTHDELSAILRTRFSSFHDLIEQGVKVDGHPAGIQVFLFYWIKIAGEKEWLVRLPFIISGILSIPLVFAIGRRWFNSSVGLISAAFLASLQYTIMYSQMARPYASGLFFVLGLVYFWDKIVFREKKEFYWYLGLILFGAASCYNHHFSFLIAILVGISGLFFMPKQRIHAYIIAGIFIAVAYIPHISIITAQLKLKGLDWLGKPELSFFLEYLKYCFHFSWFELSLILLILAVTPDFSKQIISNKFWLISIIWFAIPFSTGFIYSILIQPVLQYSVLLFSFPFMLFTIFGRVKILKSGIRIIVVFTILIVSTLTLIFVRNHYSIFYESAFKEIPMKAEKAFLKEGKNNISIILEGNHQKLGYYISGLNTTFPFVWIDSFPSKPDFIRFIKSIPQKNIIYAAQGLSDQSRRTIIEDEFPFLVEQKNYFTGVFLEFSKDSMKGKKPARAYFEKNIFNDEKQENWTTIFPEYISDLQFHSAPTSYKLREKMEWGPAFTLPVKDLNLKKSDWIDIAVNIYCVDSIPPEVILVASLKSGQKQMYWNGADLRNFWLKPGWNRLILNLSIIDLPFIRKDQVFTTYIWNKGLRNIFIDDYEIAVKEGNPRIYGFYYNMEK